MLTKPHLTHPDGAKRLLRVRAAALYLSVSEWTGGPGYVSILTPEGAPRESCATPQSLI